MSAGLGERALKARLLLGIKKGRSVSQSEIGTALGVTGVTVGRWEKTGGGEPESLELIEKYAKVLEVSPAWLAFGLGQMEPEEEHFPLSPPTPGQHLQPSIHKRKRGSGTDGR